MNIKKSCGETSWLVSPQILLKFVSVYCVLMHNDREGFILKSFFLRIIGIFMFLISALLVCYPFISNYLMSLNQNSTIESYEQDMQLVDEEKLALARREAEEYNKNLLGKVVLTDPFDPGAESVKDAEYENLLNLSSNLVMASIEIPIINVNLPIYHGTSDLVLQQGAGHLQKTSLPIGGEGTHAVITGHTGLSSARLFTDLNLLKKGDTFYIHCLNDTLAYQIDQIKVVKPNDTNDLRIDSQQDYVTLVTCTPYGVNSHRLLVRGTRIPYTESEKSALSHIRESQSTWMKEYKRAVFAGCAVLAIVLVIFIVVRILCNKKRRKVKRQHR